MNSLPEPYYDRDGITIYHGDAREILPLLEPDSVDLVLTDPPYGIARVWGGGNGHGWSNAWRLTDERNEWDEQPPDEEVLNHCIRVGKTAVIWGGNYFPLPPSRGWLVWNKPERGFTLSEAELAWTSIDTVVRVKDLPRSEYGRRHPTQKPVALMKWCIQKAKTPPGGLILDPFMGSGTTLRAAKDLGRRAIGIEIEERYVEIAVKRLQQSVLPLEVTP